MDMPETNHKLKIMSQDELEANGWCIPSFEQLSKNMEKRLKKVRGEDYDDEKFLTLHNYKSNSNCYQA